MATKAGPVPPPINHETAYRRKLVEYVEAAWSRISRDPFSDVEDLVEMIALKAIEDMTGKVNVYNLRKVTSALKDIGTLQQTKAAAAEVTAVITLARQANIALVRNVTDQQRDMARTEIGAVDAGTPLEQRLSARLGVSKRRAKVIARDQVSKINADLSETRHKAAGSEEYEWSTSGDERVRAEHQALDGDRFRYDDPNGGDNGQKPGQPVLCRCIGLALYE